MRIVLGTHHLASIGGGETYLVTLAEQLIRLGHHVVVHAVEQGEMAEVARGRGVEVAAFEQELPQDVDAVISQHASHAVEMAERYPGTPLLFVTHGITWDCQLPPQVAGVTSCVIAFNDRTARRAAAAAVAPEVIRLRQPIDLQRFSPRGPVREQPRRVLLLGNYLRGGPRRHLLDACRGMGLTHTQIGAHGTSSPPNPECAMGDADIVVGYGRSALEGMASGRAVLVYDHSGGDGWVTPESYGELEADGFAGTASEEVLDLAALRRLLAGYRPEMGPACRELARKHHDATRHGVEVAEVLAGLVPAPGAGGAPPGESSRLLRNQWRSDGLAAGAAIEAHTARERLAETEAELDRLRARAAAVALNEQQNAAFRATRRYRAAATAGRMLDALRRLRLRGRSER